jgi:hypothetical protein
MNKTKLALKTALAVHRAKRAVGKATAAVKKGGASVTKKLRGK